MPAQGNAGNALGSGITRTSAPHRGNRNRESDGAPMFSGCPVGARVTMANRIPRALPWADIQIALWAVFMARRPALYAVATLRNRPKRAS